MPHECDVPGADRLDGGDGVIAERRKVPVAAPGTRFTVATEVQGDDVVPLGKDVELPAPEGAVARPPVDEGHSGCIPVGAAVAFVRDLDAVAAPCHAGSMADAISLRVLRASDARRRHSITRRRQVGTDGASATLRSRRRSSSEHETANALDDVSFRRSGGLFYSLGLGGAAVD